MHHLLPASGDCIGEEQEKITGLRHPQRRVDCQLFIRNDADATVVDSAGTEGVADYLGNRITVAAAEVVIPPADVVIKATTGGGGTDVTEVIVTSIAGSGDHADAPMLDVQTPGQLAQLVDGSGVMSVVHDDLERMLIVNVESAGGLIEGRVEGA